MKCRYVECFRVFRFCCGCLLLVFFEVQAVVLIVRGRLQPRGFRNAVAVLLLMLPLYAFVLGLAAWMRYPAAVAWVGF